MTYKPKHDGYALDGYGTIKGPFDWDAVKGLWRAGDETYLLDGSYNMVSPGRSDLVSEYIPPSKREPRVVYINEYSHGLNHAAHPTLASATQCSMICDGLGQKRVPNYIATRKFIEVEE